METQLLGSVGCKVFKTVNDLNPNFIRNTLSFSFPWESPYFQVINECGSYFSQVYYDWESYYFGGLFERSLMTLSSIYQR